MGVFTEAISKVSYKSTYFSGTKACVYLIGLYAACSKINIKEPSLIDG